MKYRLLDDSEIRRLSMNGCSCDDWSRVYVADGFDPSYVSRTVFSGDIRIGIFSSYHNLGDGVRIHSGIYNAHLCDVSVGDNVLIYNVSGYVSGYSIEENAVIADCGRVSSYEGCTFGCGTEVSVLDETGGRSVRIFPGLSAQLAWLAVFDRSSSFQNAMLSIMDRVSAEVCSSGPVIGKGAVLSGCRRISGVVFGPGAVADGVESLKNGFVAEGVFVGPGVIMQDFITGRNSSIDSGSFVSGTYVGEYVRIGSHFSSQHSLVFSNCHFENGEICAAFAGPHTVAHHKSILLIGGMYSFFNAGSGANHSNHLYSLGPWHYGVLERGCKMASDAYVMMPAYIGAYSLILGRHRRHCDTSAFPFSYLIEKEGYSYCMPGAVLTGVGLYRDISKWPKRDRRPGGKGEDKVVYDLFTPLLCSRMISAKEILEAALAGEQRCGNVRIDISEKGEYIIDGLYFTPDSVHKGVRYYGWALAYAGGDVTMYDENACDADISKWCDVAGLMAPESVIRGIASDISQNRLSDLKDIDLAFGAVLENYPLFKSKWISVMNKGKDREELIKGREDAVSSLNRLIENSAKRDISLANMLEKGDTVYDTSKYSDLLLK